MYDDGNEILISFNIDSDNALRPNKVDSIVFAFMSKCYGIRLSVIVVVRTTQNFKAVIYGRLTTTTMSLDPHKKRGKSYEFTRYNG